MKQFRWMVMGGALAMTLGFVLAPAAPAGAQQPGGASSPTAQQPGAASSPAVQLPPPPNKVTTSPEYIDWQLGTAVIQLQRALEMQTNGTTPDPEQTSKIIYDGYVKVRSAHALLMRRKDKREAKTGMPDPMLGLAYTTVRKARFSVLYARQAAAKSQTEQSVGHLTTALAYLERARAIIN